MNDAGKMMRQYIDAVTRHDFGAIRQLLHPQYSYTGSNGQRQEGPEAAVAMARTYTAAFPDLQFDVQAAHDVGDSLAVTEFIIRATHQGELMGIAPTGRSVVIPVCNVIEVREGKIYAEREYFDFAHVLQQLGAAAGAAHA